MSLTSQLGMGSISWIHNINIYSLLHGVSEFIAILFLFAIVGGILYLTYYIKQNKKNFSIKVVWFEEIHGDTVYVGSDMAMELVAPGTNIKVLMIKNGKNKIYLPMPTIKMSPKEYWYIIEKGELKNFKLGTINDNSSVIKYDHNDQRYANANVSKIINDSFRKKSQVWWREYKDVIAVTILIFMLTLSFLFLIGKIGGLIDKVGGLMKIATANAHCSNAVSGIISK